MVLEHAEEYASQWAAIRSIASKLGGAAETLRHWVRQAERDQGKRPGLTTDERQRLKQALPCFLGKANHLLRAYLVTHDEPEEEHSGRHNSAVV
jgi:transposase-like protein